MGSQVRDISALEGAPLSQLDLTRCSQISDFSVLKTLSSVSDLKVGHTQLKDLSVINGEPLRLLDIAGLSITDLSPLAGMNLQSLNLSKTPVKDLTPIVGMPLTRLSPPPKDQLTTDSLKLIEQLQKQGCSITWE